MRGGQPYAGTVDADDADAKLGGGDSSSLRDLTAGPGRTVEPDERPTVDRTELSEAELAAFADRDRPLDPWRGDEARSVTGSNHARLFRSAHSRCPNRPIPGAAPRRQRVTRTGTFE